MANLKIPTRVTGPDEIEVTLVRGDYHETSGLLRTFFEIFLSISSCVLGVILSIEKPTMIHWCFLSVTSISSLTFLVLTLRFYNKAKKLN